MSETIITQLSALPEERPHTNIVVKTKPAYKSLYREMQKEIKKLGAYSFAKKAIELESKTDEYSIAKHKLTTKEVYSIADSAFQDFTNLTLDIKTFLNNVRQIPGYRIPTTRYR